MKNLENFKKVCSIYKTPFEDLRLHLCLNTFEFFDDAKLDNHRLNYIRKGNNPIGLFINLDDVVRFWKTIYKNIDDFKYEICIDDMLQHHSDSTTEYSLNLIEWLNSCVEKFNNLDVFTESNLETIESTHLKNIVSKLLDPKNSKLVEDFSKIRKNTIQKIFHTNSNSKDFLKTWFENLTNEQKNYVKMQVSKTS